MPDTISTAGTRPRLDFQEHLADLEKQGLLTSEWNTDEARPRKFYRTSPAGESLAAELTADWRRIDDALTRLTTGDER